MATPIRQPRNTAKMTWSNGFAHKWNAMFEQAQKTVDSECIRYMAQYTPTRNTLLRKSATLGTVIGSGHIYYQSPYARFQYYGKVMVSSITGSAWARRGEKKVLTNRDLKYSTARVPKAQKLWFEVMKANHKAVIRQKAADKFRGTL